MSKKYLGAILVEKGYVSKSTLHKALLFQQKKRDEGNSATLGEILVSSKVVTQEQLKATLIEQRSRNRKSAGTLRSKTDLESVHGRLYPKLEDKYGNKLVEQSAITNIFVVESDHGKPFILHTEAGKKVHINAFLKTQEKLEKSYNDDRSKPKHLLVSQNLIDIFLAVAKNQGTEEDQTDAEHRFEKILRDGFEAGASDIHFFRTEDHCIIRFRIYGNVRTYDEMPAEAADTLMGVGFSSFGQGGSDVYWKSTIRQRIRMRFTYSEHITVAGRYEHSPGDDGQYHCCIRLMPDDRRELNKEIDFLKLGFTQAQTNLLKASASKSSGFVCFAGPTGSGKSTTMAGLVKWLNRDDDINILTVESPIERPLPAFQTSVSDADDADPKEFADAIKSTLRRDPDLLLVGEIRDVYSAEAAVSGVQTGHLLLSSIHAQSAIEVVERMSSSALKIPTQTIGSPNFISALVFQMLLPKLDDQTRIRLTTVNVQDYLNEEMAARLLRAVPDLDTSNVCVRGSRPEYPEGISGMTICAEVLSPDQAMRSYFQELKLNEAVMHWKQLGEKDWGKPLNERCTGFFAIDHAFAKMKLGMIDPRDMEADFGFLLPEELEVESIPPSSKAKKSHNSEALLSKSSAEFSV